MTPPTGACAHAHDDAAYVLGALSPTERLASERHLPTCEPCSRSVRSLAGMPGLLDLADPDVLEDPAPGPALPPAVLASLTRTVVARRRRRAIVVAALAGAAALVLAVPAALDLADRTSVAPPSSTAAGADVAETRAMVAQGDVPLTAELGLEPVTWGTRIVLTCTYDRNALGSVLPEEVDYLLYVTDDRGRTEQVGSWTSVSGTTMTVPAATAVRRDDIADVEVRTTDGRVVLRLGA